MGLPARSRGRYYSTRGVPHLVPQAGTSRKPQRERGQLRAPAAEPTRPLGPATLHLAAPRGKLVFPSGPPEGTNQPRPPHLNQRPGWRRRNQALGRRAGAGKAVRGQAKTVCPRMSRLNPKVGNSRGARALNAHDMQW